LPLIDGILLVDDVVVVVVLLEQPANKSAVDNAVIFNVEIKFISFPFLIIKISHYLRKNWL